MAEEKDTTIENEVEEVSPPVDDLNDDNDFYPRALAMPKTEVRVKTRTGIRGKKLTKNRDRISPSDPNQTDYVRYGSETHAQLLGLIPITVVEAEKRKKIGLPESPWELLDITKYGVSATDRYLETILLQKVSELNTPPVNVQSEYPLDAGYAKPLWIPADSVDASGKPAMNKTKGIV